MCGVRKVALLRRLLGRYIRGFIPENPRSEAIKVFWAQFVNSLVITILVSSYYPQLPTATRAENALPTCPAPAWSLPARLPSLLSPAAPPHPPRHP